MQRCWIATYCCSIHSFRNLETEHSFFHPAHREQVVEGSEEPVPNAVMAPAGGAWILPHGDFSHRKAFHPDQRGQEAMHAFEEFEFGNAFALEGAETTTGIADVFPGEPVANPVGNPRGGDAYEVVSLAARRNPGAAYAI